MRQELVLELIRRYPELLTADFSVLCDDGWFNLIDTVCFELYSDYQSAKSIYDNVVDNIGNPMYPTMDKSPTVTYEIVKNSLEEMKVRRDKIPKLKQIKEKFGSLRFCVDGLSETQRTKVNFAELLSTKICESCGNSEPNSVFCYAVGYRRTICESCQKKI